MPELIIREAWQSDVAAIHAIHLASIRGLCSSSYSVEVINAWVSNPDVERFGRQMDAGIRYVLAMKSGTACGFAALDVADAKITALFVHPAHSGNGIGMRLLRELEKMATDNGIGELQVDASLNARRFYETHGYGGGMPGKYRLSAGLEIDSVRLTEKLLP